MKTNLIPTGWVQQTFSSFTDAMNWAFGESLATGTFTAVSGTIVTDAAAAFPSTYEGAVLVNTTKKVFDSIASVGSGTQLTLERLSQCETNDEYEIRSVGGCSQFVDLRIDYRDSRYVVTAQSRNDDQDAYLVVEDSNSLDANWLLPTDPSTVDTDEGEITAAEQAGVGVHKVYRLPTGKEFHEVTIAPAATSGTDFDLQWKIFGADTLPTVGATSTNDYMSHCTLLHPTAYRTTRDPANPTPRPVLQTRCTYLVIYLATATTAADVSMEARVRSWNQGDGVV
jgi:hypothetical protein